MESKNAVVEQRIAGLVRGFFLPVRNAKKQLTQLRSNILYFFKQEANDFFRYVAPNHYPQIILYPL